MNRRILSTLLITLFVFGLTFTTEAAPNDFLIDNGVLIRYLGSSKDIVIPNGVTVIEKDAFFWTNNKYIQSITMPDTVIALNDYAFSNASSLTKLTLSKNLKTIGEGAFSECKSLKAVQLPSGVESIGDYAFKGCKSLKTINIPISVKSIGEAAFKECSSLPALAIPKTVSYIGKSALPSLKKGTGDFLIVGDGILCKYYGKGGNITIPVGVKSISSDFLPHPLTPVPGKPGIVNSTDKTITSVTIPGTVKRIEAGAFEDCDNLTSVIINEGVEYIGADAFARCPKLKQVKIPASLTQWGSSPFSSPFGLKSKYDNELEYEVPWRAALTKEFNIENGILLKYNGTAADVVIPQGVKVIAGSAFSDADSMKSIVIPDSVVSIGDYAFNSCSNLHSVKVPGSVSYLGKGAFYDCRYLYSVELPKGLKQISESTFGGCQSLSNVIIPDTVEVIGKKAFGEWCYSLKHIVIPSSVKRIEKYAFYNCILDNVVIPASVDYIGEIAFGGNSHINNITIGNPNAYVYKTAFYESPNVNITAPAGGLVQRMAIRNKIPFKEMNN